MSEEETSSQSFEQKTTPPQNAHGEPEQQEVAAQPQHQQRRRSFVPFGAKLSSLFSRSSRKSISEEKGTADKSNDDQQKNKESAQKAEGELAQDENNERPVEATCSAGEQGESKECDKLAELAEEPEESESELIQPVVDLSAVSGESAATGATSAPGEASASSATAEQAAKPVPKARRLGRRRSSTVHPLGEGGDKSPGRMRQLMMRLAMPVEQSMPGPWVYVQTADRTFKRTTEAQLQAEQSRRQTLVNDGQTSPILLPEFASVAMALCAQNAFHNFALILQGFVSGVAFGHTMFAFFFADLDVLSHKWWMTSPVQAFFYACLAIGVIDALDRFPIEASPPAQSPLGHHLRSFLSLPALGVLVWFGALLASIAGAQIDELLARNDAESLQKDDQSLLALWRYLSAARAGCVLLGWLLLAARPEANATRQQLAEMMPSDGLANKKGSQSPAPDKDVPIESGKERNEV